MHYVYSVFLCMSLTLTILHQLYGDISKELVRCLQRKMKTHTMIFNIPDIHVASPPCGPGDVSGGGPAE